MKKTFNKILLTRIILSITLVLLTFFVFIFQGNIETLLTGKNYKDFQNSAFQMHFVDVGQGDSILLEFENGENMIIDCGTYVVPEAVDKVLKENDIKTIDYLVYTHSDKDHVGGGEFIFENYEVEVLYRPKLYCKDEVKDDGYFDTHTTDVYNDSIMAAYNEDGCEIRYSFKGENFMIGDCEITFLSPSQNTYSNKNDYSAVIMVEVDSKKILLTGDAEEDVEMQMIDDYGNFLHADILKVGHHGSESSSCDEFIDAVSPEFAIISAGENYGHPHQEVLERLQDNNVANIYSTKEVETISVGIDNGKIAFHFSSMKKDFDFPIFVVCVIIFLLLIWGIKVKSLKK